MQRAVALRGQELVVAAGLPLMGEEMVGLQVASWAGGRCRLARAPGQVVCRSPHLAAMPVAAGVVVLAAVVRGLGEGPAVVGLARVGVRVGVEVALWVAGKGEGVGVEGMVVLVKAAGRAAGRGVARAAGRAAAMAAGRGVARGVGMAAVMAGGPFGSSLAGRYPRRLPRIHSQTASSPRSLAGEGAGAAGVGMHGVEAGSGTAGCCPWLVEEVW